MVMIFNKCPHCGGIKWKTLKKHIAWQCLNPKCMRIKLAPGYTMKVERNDQLVKHHNGQNKINPGNTETTIKKEGGDSNEK